MPAPKGNFFLHCDDPECGTDVHFDEPMAEKHIGHACPDCGADMLTRSDYDAGMRIQFGLRMLEKMGLVAPHTPGDPVQPGMQAMRFHYHDGKLTTRTAD